MWAVHILFWLHHYSSVLGKLLSVLSTPCAHLFLYPGCFEVPLICSVLITGPISLLYPWCGEILLSPVQYLSSPL